MDQKHTLVVGASDNPERYSNIAIHMLREAGYSVVAIGNKKGKVRDVDFDKQKEAFEDIDTVTLYLNPMRQEEYYDYILNLNPSRIIFNPGTENEEFERMAMEKGIKVLEACTLVLIRTGQY